MLARDYSGRSVLPVAGQESDRCVTTDRASGRSWSTRPLRVAASLVVTAALLLGLGVWASRRALPGDALYSVKRAWESAQLAFTHGTDRGTAPFRPAGRASF